LSGQEGAGRKKHKNPPDLTVSKAASWLVGKTAAVKQIGDHP
jgi:hypothetical protein